MQMHSLIRHHFHLIHFLVCPLIQFSWYCQVCYTLLKYGSWSALSLHSDTVGLGISDCQIYEENYLTSCLGKTGSLFELPVVCLVALAAVRVHTLA